MKIWFLLIVVSGGAMLLPFSGGDKGYEPMFFCMQDEYHQIEKEKKITTFLSENELLTHELSILTDAEDHPLLYYSKLKTPVCIDGLCKPVRIALYWNLLGNYAGFGIDEAYPLTKFDHKKFENGDYQQLHALLLDPHSILERKKVEDLFDPKQEAEEQIEYQGRKIDAASGATKREIKESVVEGALYSCYTLWHLVHGEAAEKIRKHTASLYSPELEKYLLYSDYTDYHLYALKQLNDSAFQQHSAQLLFIFREDSPLLRTYLLKKMPEALWTDPTFCRSLYQAFMDIDSNSRTLLIEHLPEAHKAAPEWLSSQVRAMTKNHVKSYLAYLDEHPDKCSSVVRGNLEKVAEEGDYSYSYLISVFLESAEGH